MLQLESFFDPTHMKDLEFSEDPVPNFRKLKEEFSSGYLTVPSVGAGTANTEFEVITGMNLEYFGPGEYPYKTILRKTTAESINYNLKDIGYRTFLCYYELHALHIRYLLNYSLYFQQLFYVKSFYMDIHLVQSIQGSFQ